MHHLTLEKDQFQPCCCQPECLLSSFKPPMTLRRMISFPRHLQDSQYSPTLDGQDQVLPPAAAGDVPTGQHMRFVPVLRHPSALPLHPLGSASLLCVLSAGALRNNLPPLFCSLSQLWRSLLEQTVLLPDMQKPCGIGPSGQAGSALCGRGSMLCTGSCNCYIYREREQYI